MDEEMLEARQKYFESATKLAQANDCAIIVGETTITPTDEMKEIITRNLQAEFRDACKEYYDALCKLRETIWNEYHDARKEYYDTMCKLKDTIWNEYMKTFES